jgi:hypothetical protein
LLEGVTFKILGLQELELKAKDNTELRIEDLAVC